MSPQGSINPAWVNRAARDYRALLNGISPTARRVTDKRPQNFHVMALIHSVFPRARIIHCRRHPVDTCLSIYFQNFAWKLDFAWDRSDLVSSYRQYLRLMAHWRSVLPADRLLEVRYEELVVDREPLTRKMIDFCPPDWNEACLHSERNRRPVRTASGGSPPASLPDVRGALASLRAVAGYSSGTAGCGLMTHVALHVC